MILYSNDRQLLRTLRKIQKSETNFLFISADYTFCVPIEKPDPKYVQPALQQQHCKFSLEPPEVQGALISLENNLCIYHPGGQYVQVTPYGWRWKYLSRQNMKLLLLQSVLCPILVSIVSSILTCLILEALKE